MPASTNEKSSGAAPKSTILKLYVVGMPFSAYNIDTTYYANCYRYEFIHDLAPDQLERRFPVEATLSAYATFDIAAESIYSAMRAQSDDYDNDTNPNMRAVFTIEVDSTSIIDTKNEACKTYDRCGCPSDRCMYREKPANRNVYTVARDNILTVTKTRYWSGINDYARGGRRKYMHPNEVEIHTLPVNKKPFQLGLNTSTTPYEKAWNAAKGDDKSKAIAVLDKYCEGFFRSQRERAMQMVDHINFPDRHIDPTKAWKKTIKSLLFKAREPDYHSMSFFAPNTTKGSLHGEFHAALAVLNDKISLN